MTMYAIIGVKKLKSAGNIQAAIDHATRQRYTANSNGRANDVLVPPPDLGELMRELQELRPRSNAVLCHELMLTASNEYFQGKSEAEIRAWEEKSLEWARSKWGADNIRMVIAHRDELTIHLSILATPITAEGKLNARAWTGGKKAMRALWSEYAAAMKPLGLERGREFSPAKHQDIKAYYAAINKGAELAKKREIKPQELPAPELADRISPRQYAADLINRVTAFYRKENGALRSALAAERNQRERMARQVIQDRQLYNAMKENPASFRKLQEALEQETLARAKDQAKFEELTAAIRAYFRQNIPKNSPLRKQEKLGRLLQFKELQKDIKISLATAPAEREEMTRGY